MRARDAVGLEGPTYEVDIERGKIREFARAMHAPLPDFMEGRNPIIPATFLVTAPYGWGYTLERPRGTALAQIEHDLSVSLHGEESFVFHREPPRAGDRLVAQGTIERVDTRTGARGGELTLLTLLTRYRDEAGVLVAEQRSTSITADRAPGAGDWDVDLPAYAPVHSVEDPGVSFGPQRRTGWDELVEGSGPGAITLPPLTLRDTVRFQGVEGEDDPLHYDSTLARAAGYPSVFGLGMRQASLLAGYVATRIDPRTVRRFRARFANVCWPGDRLSYDFHVSRRYRNPETERRMVELELCCRRMGGDVIVNAWMTLDFG
jgi:acyl dehydratase